MNVDVSKVLKGDIVRFKSYALRVESTPHKEGNFVALSGRININGCPFVTRKYMVPLDVEIEREGGEEEDYRFAKDRDEWRHEAIEAQKLK